MTDFPPGVLDEAHRVFARAYSRKYPQSNFQQAITAFDELPSGEHAWLLATAEKVLAAWPPHPPTDPTTEQNVRQGCACPVPWSFEPGCPACGAALRRLNAEEVAR
jgi:hypothetical protein